MLREKEKRRKADEKRKRRRERKADPAKAQIESETTTDLSSATNGDQQTSIESIDAIVIQDVEHENCS